MGVGEGERGEGRYSEGEGGGGATKRRGWRGTWGGKRGEGR